MRIIFVSKVTGVDKSTIVANDTTFLCHFGFVFSNFISVKLAATSNMNRKQNSSR